MSKLGLTAVDDEIDQLTDEEFAKAIGISLGDCPLIGTGQQVNEAIDLLADADLWSCLHRPSDEERCR